jgi:hypothetical protein
MSIFDEYEAEVQAVEDEKKVWRQGVTWRGQTVGRFFTFEPEIDLEMIREHLTSLGVDYRTEGRNATGEDGTMYARIYCSHRYRI